MAEPDLHGLRELCALTESSLAHFVSVARMYFSLPSSPPYLKAFLADADLANDDRLSKYGKCLVDAFSHLPSDAAFPSPQLAGRLSKVHDMVSSLQALSAGLSSPPLHSSLRVPRVPFGKTGLDISVVTVGCMRWQQTWKQLPDMSSVKEECQENLVATMKRAILLGVNHFETARGYGCSELQMGVAFKQLFDSGFCKREDILIQTKVNPKNTAKEFREEIEKSFAFLQLEYVDLFSFHGLNREWCYDRLFNNGDNGNLYDVVEEYVKAGRVRHVGFSTHAPANEISRLIASDKFAYVNLHYHFCGSYTASGHGAYGGNLQNVIEAAKRNMGVFVISPFDKGGALYAPSRRLRSLCLPDLEPLEFGALWLWQHAVHGGAHGSGGAGAGAPVHTITIGVARPSDLDEPYFAALMLRNEPERALAKVEAVKARLARAFDEAHGEGWASEWFKGLPTCYDTTTGVDFTQYVWLYNVIKAWGMLFFAKQRYNTGKGNRAKWVNTASYEENMATQDWGYMPGLTPVKGEDYRPILRSHGVPEGQIERIMSILGEVLSLLDGTAGLSDEERRDMTEVDLRPWTAFPERS
jgi:hypothetical protein